MHSSWRKADHYPTEMLFFLDLGGIGPGDADDGPDVKFEVWVVAQLHERVPEYRLQSGFC